MLSVPQVLLRVLSCVEQHADLRAFSLTSKSMYELATDSVLMASWLMEHRPQDAVYLAAKAKRGDVVLQMITKMGVSATAMAGGDTPLQIACQHNLLNVTDHLWNREASVRANVDDAARALELAAEKNHVECIQLLLTSPSPLSANSRDTRDRYNSFPLHAAVYYGHFESVQVLLSHNASPTSLDHDGGCALHIACNSISDNETRASIIRLLLDAPQGMSVIDCQDDDYGSTPLHIAAQLGLAECCAQLCKAGAQVQLRDHGGRTPFQIARNSQVREFLASYGADQT